MMTPEEQAKALSEWFGRKIDPDDLNDVHELEWKLPKEARERYNLELIFVETGYRLPEFWQSAVSSSASQRCEALCRTLWPERFS